MSQDERIAAIEAENCQLHQQLEVALAQNRLLLERVQELEARLAKDSHNSSKPPSSDGLRRKTKSLRKPSGKKPGGQLGPRGETLHLVAVPDVVSEHRPAICVHCQTPLEGGEPVVLRERRQVQVQEVPPVRRHLTEHQRLHLRCPSCAQVSAGTFPAAAASRTQYGARLRALVVYLVQAQFLPLGRTQQLVRDLFGVRLARGTVVEWVRAGRPTASNRRTRRSRWRCGRRRCCPSDETGVRRGGGRVWAHVGVGRARHASPITP